VVHPDKDSDFFWESFLKHNPERVSELMEAKEIILSFSFNEKQPIPLHAAEKEEMWRAILSDERIDRLNFFDENIRRPALWFSLNPISRVAAVLLITFFISLMWVKMSPNKIPEVKKIVKTFTKRTEKGEKLSTKLPDGSVVVLNANSWIEYPEEFSDSTRKIKLGGEAFFDVNKDPMHPFIIESGQFITEVLGTSFAIREDKATGAYNLAVVSGRVAVSDKMGQDPGYVIYVEPDQTVYFSKSSRSFQYAPFDYSELISWKDGILYFNNANFNEIITKLENWYGVSITLNKSFDREKDFTGQFVNENLEVVLEGLSFTFDFEYDIQQNSVTIKEKS
jgi:ferric-dicitrate binding protein FerR (iron transport regulator)